MRLLLFDIDGTLVNTFGAGKRAMTRALNEVMDVEGSLDKISLSGQTDPLIVQQSFAQFGRECTALLYEDVMERYLRYLQQDIETQESPNWLLPNVRVLLESLSGNAYLALATGNVERGARMKLAPVALNAFFAVGGFACDAPMRATLVRRGAEKSEQHFERSFSPNEVVVIGDTPLDIAAAKANEFLSVGVATGVYTHEALLAAGADAVLESFADAEAYSVLQTVQPRFPKKDV